MKEETVVKLDETFEKSILAFVERYNQDLTNGKVVYEQAKEEIDEKKGGDKEGGKKEKEKKK